MQKTILSTADVARLFNVTETTVKRWADDGTLKCQKTPGGHRKFQVRDVIEFAERNQFEPVGALAYSGDDKNGPAIRVAILERDHLALVRVFVEKALSPDRSDLFGYLSFLYQHKIPLWEIFDLVVRPGMAEIGEQWVRGEIGVDQEHHASYETLDALARLQSQIRIKPLREHSVILACPGGEKHEIGLRCASYLFESEGWHTHYLGAQIPQAAIVSALRELRPSVVCLSVSMLPSHHPEVYRRCVEVAGAAKRVGAEIVIGGRGVTEKFELSSSFQCVCSSAKGLLDYIGEFERGHKEARRAK